MKKQRLVSCVYCFPLEREYIVCLKNDKLCYIQPINLKPVAHQVRVLELYSLAWLLGSWSRQMIINTPHGFLLEANFLGKSSLLMRAGNIAVISSSLNILLNSFHTV